MPDSPAPKKGKKKLSPVAIGAIVVAAGGTYWLIRRHQSQQAAAASNGLTGGSTIPGGGVSGSTPAASPNTLAQWIQQALSTITNAQYSSTAALNDINAWLAGQCVSAQGYTALGGLIGTLGVPPGYNTLPQLSVCTAPPPTTTGGGSWSAPLPGTGGTPTGSSPLPGDGTGGTSTTGNTAIGSVPGTPAGSSSPVSTPGGVPSLGAGLIAQLTTAGEHIVATAFDPQLNGGEYLYLTNLGGVYSQTQQGTPGQIWGSYLGLTGQTPLPNGQQRQFNGLTVNPDGSYTLTDTNGESYKFGNGPGQAQTK